MKKLAAQFEKFQKPNPLISSISGVVELERFNQTPFLQRLLHVSRTMEGLSQQNPLTGESLIELARNPTTLQ
jgi:hypothetical protein